MKNTTPFLKPTRVLLLLGGVAMLLIPVVEGVMPSDAWAQVLFPTEKTKAIISKAKAGDAGAQTALGQLYYFGEGGVKLSHETARAWYQKALSQNSARAKYALSGMYFRGEGGEKDHKKAYALALEAAQQGLQEAQLNVGKKLSRGDGVQRNLVHAHAWLTLAAENGSLLAYGLKVDLAKSMATKQLQQATKLADVWRELAKEK